MSVFKYKVTFGREDFMEEGTVIAKDEFEAKEKLHSMDFKQIELKKLTGLNALVKQFSADVK